MRYEDASGTFQASGPIANDDSDTLTAGSRGPATGNVITGEGTQFGSAGADSAAGAQVTALAGKGGEDTSFAGGKLSVAGEFGQLSVDAQGNYSYLANTGAPENVRDRFTYTLADNQGNSDTAALIVEIGKTPVVIKADAQQIVPGPDGVVTLPAGVELSDIMVVGRNLVVNLPDGTQLIIIDGAIFVPQLVLGGVEVPATNVAALLIGQEVQPAAGETPPSGGGNFALPPPPLDPGIPLGDLIPPTEYNYIPPEPQEVFDILDRDPEAGAASAQLDDDAQDGGNPGGVGDVEPTNDSVSGNLPGSGGDGSLEWALLETGALPAGFTAELQGNGDLWILQGADHVMTITVNPDTGAYTVTQLQAIDHPAGGNENDLSFVINFSVTDDDGDVDIGSLTIGVDDDTPIAIADPGQVTGLVDEDDLPAGNGDDADGDDDPGNADGDNDGTTTSGAAGSLLGLFSFGADQPGTSGLGTDTSGMTAQGLTSNGVALTYVVAGNTLTASAGGSTVFTLTVNDDGSWTFDLEGQLDHGVADTEDNLDIDFSSMIVGTDHDGDTVSLPDDTFVVTVDDDLPVPAGEREQVTGLVDEDDLPDGNNDNADGDDDPGDADGDGDGTTTGGDAGSLSALFNFGADQPGSVELSSDTSGLPALTSNNVAVTYAVNGNVLTASAGGSTVFTLTVNPDGSWVFDLQGQLDHEIAGTEDNLLLDFSSIIVGVDADGDTATLPPDSFVVDVDDDMPQEFEDCPDDVITVNDPGADPFTGSLNLPPVGADDPGTVTFGVVDGDPVLDTGGNPVTSGEDPLFYFINEEGVLEARVGDETGELIFTITLNGDGTFTYDQIGTIGIGGTITFDNFDEADAGNTNYVGLGNDDPSSPVDLLMSAGENTDADPAIEDTTVNTDSDSIGAQNQSMDANDSEVLRLDFVSDLQTGGAGPTGFSFSGHVATNSYLQLVPQVQGSQDAVAAFKVWALDSTLTDADEPDRNPTDGFSDATPVTITEVTIVDFETGETYSEDISGLANGATEVLDFGVSVTRNADGSVTFSGIQEGDQYGVATGANDFNAIAVQATDHSFDLGVFSIGVANEFEPVDLQVPIVLTDADGDPVECDIDIHIGVPLEAQDITVTVNEAGLDLVGSNPLSDSETQGGDLQGQVTGGTGPYTFAFAPGEDGAGAYGTLTLEIDGTFSYTLETPFDSQPDADDGTNPELGAESFQVVATDSLGATQTLTIKVNIIDDVPTANDDVGNQANEGDPITVNVLNNDVEGADGVDEDNNPAVKVELVDGTLTGAGDLVYNNDGTFTYTPDAGEEGEITFDYQITDNDGDTSVATVTINLEDDSEPQIGTPENLEVDEDGFAFANDDAAPLQSDPSETDHDENLTDSGDVVVDFGNDVPDAPLVDSIELLDDPSYDGQLTDLDGNPVNFALNGSGQLVGTANGVQVMIISISGAVAGPGAGEVTYSYQAQLLQPVMHADEGNTENDALLSGIQFQVTDSDGDPASSSFDVTVWDDVPSATDEPQQDVAEDSGISGTFDFVEGADGAGVTHINGIELNFGGDDWSQWIAVDDGQIRAQADGSYEFEPDGSASGVTSGTFTVTDGDGDEVVADWAFNITDSGTPTAGESSARLDDDGLSGGNPLSVTNDIDANVGERVGEENPEEDIFNGQLTLNFGGDGPGSVTFAAMDGETRSVGTETVLLEWDGVDTLTATINDGGSRDGTVLFDIVLDTTTGEYTLTLRDNVIHAAGGNETSAPDLELTYTVTDSDNSPAGGVDGTLTITFNDDAPTVTNAQPGAGVDVDETDGFPTSDTSASAVITATQAFGADGAAAANSVVYGLSIVGGSPEPSGLETTVGGHDITLVQIDSNTIEGQYNGTNVAFTIDIGSDGRVTLTQNVALNHSEDGGPAPTDHNDALDLDGLVNATITITDGDGDTATASAPIGDNLVFLDDGPDSAVNAQVSVPTVTLDETRPVGQDEGGPNVTTGLATVTVGFAGKFLAADHGSDGAGTVSYQLLLSADGEGSGLYALDNTDTESVIDGYGQGAEILLFSEADGSITGRTTDGGPVYFTISVNASGQVTFTQNLNVWHADSSDDDDTSGLSAAGETLMLQQTVTDGDGDFDTSAIDLSDGVFFIEDDGPEITLATDAQGDNTGLTPTATGDFAFDIGTDSPNGGNDDIFIDPSSVVIEINNVAIDPADITFTDDGEDADFANFSFEFPYNTGSGGTVIATGTLVFDKNAGTYTVTLTSGPIEGFSTLETAKGTAFVGYQLNDDPSDPDVLDNTQPQVAVTTIVEESAPGENDGFYVQFTGFTAGNGSHETIDYDLVDPSTGNGVDNSWIEGELFSEGTGATALTQSWVSVSNASNGVGGDTVNGPDALNFSLYSSNPGGTFGGTPTASASDMFLVFDGTDSGDDFIVVLKLFDPDSGEYTTKSIVVEGSDIYFFDAGSEAATVAALAGTPYENVVADIVALGGSNNNDGLVIIESNDYNTGTENWVIVGAQIVNTNSGVSGTGINLDGDVGDDGNSTGTQSFAVADDTAPMKITNIGFLAGSSNDQAMELSFDVTITDADGDSETTSLTATIGDPPAETLVATSFSAQDEQLQKSAANSNTLTIAAAVAAAGMAESAAASPPANDQSFDAESESSASTQQVSMVLADDGGDEGSSAVSGLPETSEAEASGNSGGHSRSAEHRSDNSLDASSNQQAPEESSSHQAANDQGPATEAAAANAVAPTVGMPSAEALLAAGLTGETGKHTGQVEEILADALGQGGAPTVDGLLAHLSGGLGELAAISNVASPAAGDVPGWDMAMHGGSGFAADVLTKLDAAMLQHHDAVQPAVNG